MSKRDIIIGLACWYGQLCD